jgi:RNA polymerase sigma factor (TIGR02999 family)
MRKFGRKTFIPEPDPDEKRKLDELFSRLYNKIRDLAARIRWRGENPTLNPTALAHEAYLKLLKSPPDLAAKTSEEVIAVFANAMRQILIDAARRRKAKKRAPAAAPENLDSPVDDALALEQIVESLNRENPRLGRIVDCRFYLGMTVEETAAALQLSATMVERDWREAKAYLGGKLR